MEHTPAWLAGVWQRTLLTTSDGRHDASTLVLWMQTASGAYADLRIPADLAAGFPTSLVAQDKRTCPPAQQDKVALWQRLAEQEVRRCESCFHKQACSGQLMLCNTAGLRRHD